MLSSKSFQMGHIDSLNSWKSVHIVSSMDRVRNRRVLKNRAPPLLAGFFLENRDLSTTFCQRIDQKLTEKARYDIVILVLIQELYEYWMTTFSTLWE